MEISDTLSGTSDLLTGRVCFLTGTSMQRLSRIFNRTSYETLRAIIERENEFVEYKTKDGELRSYRVIDRIGDSVVGTERTGFSPVKCWKRTINVDGRTIILSETYIFK